MAFVKVKDIKGLVSFVDPEKVTGYSINERAKDHHDVTLDAGSVYTQLWNPDSELGGWETAQAAQDYVEKFFADYEENKRKLKREEEAVPPYRLPQVGDLYRIHDRYWVVTHIDVPADSGVYSTYIALLMTEEERKPGGYLYTKTTSRMSTFFHVHAEYVGHVSSHLEAARQLLGSFYQGKESLAYVLDGFTGREGLAVHYGLAGTESTYCCGKKLPLAKGHVITDNEHGVTCPEFDRTESYEAGPPEGVFTVVHYARPEDNSVRCCEATYPLPDSETWSSHIPSVTCDKFSVVHYHHGDEHSVRTACCRRRFSNFKNGETWSSEKDEVTCPYFRSTEAVNSGDEA